MISRNNKTTAYIPVGLGNLLQGLLKKSKENSTFNEITACENLAPEGS